MAHFHTSQLGEHLRNAKLNCAASVTKTNFISSGQQKKLSALVNRNSKKLTVLYIWGKADV